MSDRQLAPTDEVAVETVRAALRGHRLRCTGERVQVMLTLTAAGGHLSAADIHQRIVAGGHRLNLSTVYRTVTLLHGLGIVHALALPDQPVSYGIVEQPHHHAVCTCCQSVTEVPAAVLSDAVDLVQQATGYRLEQSSLQLNGLCARCRALASS